MNIFMQIFSYILFNNSNTLCGSARYGYAAAANTHDENISDVDDEINFGAGLDKEFDYFMVVDW